MQTMPSSTTTRSTMDLGGDNRLAYDDLYPTIQRALAGREFNAYADTVLKACRMNAVPITAVPSAREASAAVELHEHFHTFDQWVHNIALTLEGENHEH